MRKKRLANHSGRTRFAGRLSAGVRAVRTSLPGPERCSLFTLLAIYGAASLIHFIHNAEFLGDYPNLPKSWSPVHVYLAWLAMTAVGVLGWLLLSRGLVLAGLFALVVYAGLGLDSLGHYVLAPLSGHTVAMNVTILAEVTAAGCVLLEVTRQLARHLFVRGHDRRRTIAPPGAGRP